MAERTAVAQVVNVGVEATPGTAVTAARRLQTIGISPSIAANTEQFRPAGYRFDTVSQITREHVEADLEGRPSYNEVVYPLSSLLGAATITSPDATNAPSARLWTFAPPSTTRVEPVTLTVEQGSDVRAHRFTYGVVSDLDFTLDRDGFEIGGSLFGRRLEDGVTLNAAPTETALVPISPNEFSVFLDATSGALGTTKLGRLLSAEVTLGSRYAPMYVVDAAQPSFSAHVEQPFDAELTLTVQADAEGMGLLTAMRNQGTRFVRLEGVGPLIGGTTSHRFTLDLAAKITDTGGFSDEDGVYAVEWTCRIVHDSGWTRALRAEVVNTLAAL